jgi:hypothetical protein
MTKENEEIDLTGNLDHDDWKTILALAKALQDRAKLLEAQAKAHIIDDLLPSEPETVYMGGAPFASISVTKGGSSTKLAVLDSEAYLEWLGRNGHEEDVEYVPRVKDYAGEPSFIEKLAEQHAGELPAGTGNKTTISRQTVRVSLEKSVKDKPLYFNAIPELMPLLGIEAPRPMATQSEPAASEEEEADNWEAN